MAKHLPAMRETWVLFLGREDPLEKEMAIHSSTLAWKIPWKEEPDRLQSMGSQRVGHDWATSLSLHYLGAKWPWTSYLTYQCLGFLLCKMNVARRVPNLNSFYEDLISYVCKVLQAGTGNNKLSLLSLRTPATQVKPILCVPFIFFSSFSSLLALESEYFLLIFLPIC